MRAMEWLATSPERPGVFAFAQGSRGIFAIGQGAVGIVAIGQVAAGVIAIGQGAFGWIGWGQAGVGIFHAAGMVGVGGRGLGIVLPLVPRVGKPRALPPAIAFADVWSGQQSGWVEVRLDAGSGVPALLDPASLQRLPVKITAQLVGGLRQLESRQRTRVLADLRREGDVIVCDRAVYEPPRPYQTQGGLFMAHLVLGFLGLVGVAVVWWAVVGRELIVILNEVAG